MRSMHLPGTGLRLRYRRGAGALVAVLLLAALAGTGLAAHYAAQHSARQMASAFEGGRVFGAWVLAAHRASQEVGFLGPPRAAALLRADACRASGFRRRAAGSARAGRPRRRLCGRNHGRRARPGRTPSRGDGLRRAGAGSHGGGSGTAERRDRRRTCGDRRSRQHRHGHGRSRTRHRGRSRSAAGSRHLLRHRRCGAALRGRGPVPAPAAPGGRA